MKNFYFLLLNLIPFLTIAQTHPWQNLPSLAIYNSTTRIVCEKYKKNGEKRDTILSTGTGFFFNFNKTKSPTDSNLAFVVPCLVTNKHVVEGREKGHFLMTVATKDHKADYGNFVTIEFTKNDWIYHPDTSVDICILKLGPVMKRFRDSSGIECHYYPLDFESIPSDEEWNLMDDLEDIIIVGYPKGLWDKENNLPISRKGITATPLNLNFEGSQQFLVDAPIYQGSSGSPVFIYNRGTFVDIDSEIKLGNRLYLIGIIYEMYTYNQDGTIKSIHIPTEKEPTIMQTKVPLNIGKAIKSSELQVFETFFKTGKLSIMKK